MKVFITGGAGYIGSVTTKMLIDDGHEAVVFDSLERGHRSAVDARATFIQGDLRDRSSILKAVSDAKPDVVMHFAAYALVGESMEHPERYFDNNVRGGIHLAEAMLKARVRKIVFSSTCATYGEPDQAVITEHTIQRPTNPYGESKLMLERILDWYARIHGLEPVFLRYFNAAGASSEFGEDHDPETHLIPNVLKVALGQADTVRIFGDDYETPDGTCIRDFIHVNDLARAHVMSITGRDSGIQGASLSVNLGTGSGHSVLEVVKTARAITGHPIPTVVCPRRAGDPPRLVAGSERAAEQLGWRPEQSGLNRIIGSAWTWHQAHPDGYGQ